MMEPSDPLASKESKAWLDPKESPEIQVGRQELMEPQVPKDLSARQGK